MNQVYDHIETILLTEKATLLSEKLNKYVFRVPPSANKLQIKRAVEVIFNKKVLEMYNNKCELIKMIREMEKICEFYGGKVNPFQKAKFFCYA
jgi:ribosomal protein L23